MPWELNNVLWRCVCAIAMTIYETPMRKRRHLFSTRVVKQMANPRVRRTSGFHFLTTSVEKRCLRLSWSFMLSHKVIHLKGMCHRLNLNKTTTNGLVRVWDISSSLENIMSFTNSPKISDLHMYSLPLLKFKFWLMRLCDKASKKAIWSCDWM